MQRYLLLLGLVLLVSLPTWALKTNSRGDAFAEDEMQLGNMEEDDEGGRDLHAGMAELNQGWESKTTYTKRVVRWRYRVRQSWTKRWEQWCVKSSNTLAEDQEDERVAANNSEKEEWFGVYLRYSIILSSAARNWGYKEGDHYCFWRQYKFRVYTIRIVPYFKSYRVTQD